MKKITIIVCGLALAGCNANSEWAKISAAVGQIDNTLAQLSGNSIPKACAIIAVADSYFQDLKANISAKNIAIEAKAMAAAQVICNNRRPTPSRHSSRFGISGRLFRIRPRRTEGLAMSYVLSEGAMEKLINDVADVRAGQAFLKQSVERMEEKLDKALEEHDERIRALETYKDKQLGLMSLAAFSWRVVTWSFDHLKGLFK